LAGAAPAYAVLDDRIEIWAAENITHDSNVLRLSKNLSPGSVGATQLSDTIYTTHLGINGNLPISQQLFTAEYTRYRSNYKHFDDLDFTGYTARAHWQWLWGQDKNGTLGYAATPWVHLELFYAGTRQTIDRPGGTLDRNRIGFQVTTAKPVRVQ